MPNEDYINKSKIEHVHKAIDYYIDILVKTTDKVLFLKSALEELSKKPKLSADEQKLKEEHKTNIDNYTSGIKDIHKHLEILHGMMGAYSNNTDIDLLL